MSLRGRIIRTVFYINKNIIISPGTNLPQIKLYTNAYRHFIDAISFQNFIYNFPIDIAILFTCELKPSLNNNSIPLTYRHFNVASFSVGPLISYTNIYVTWYNLSHGRTVWHLFSICCRLIMLIN